MNIARIPPSILKKREMLCGGCSCGVNKLDACAICPKGKWRQFFCEESFDPPLPLPLLPDEKTEPPSLTTMIRSAAASAATWASRGFQHTDEETLKTRLETCGKCEFWNAQGFRGTGRCMKCGCSTWAKLRMATEKCPIGRWGPSV
jgi:hypothetical protein